MTTPSKEFSDRQASEFLTLFKRRIDEGTEQAKIILDSAKDVRTKMYFSIFVEKGYLKRLVEMYNTGDGTLAEEWLEVSVRPTRRVALLDADGSHLIDVPPLLLPVGFDHEKYVSRTLTHIARQSSRDYMLSCKSFDINVTDEYDAGREEIEQEWLNFFLALGLSEVNTPDVPLEVTPIDDDDEELYEG